MIQTTNGVVKCGDVREATSALLDGEPAGVEPAVLEAHFGSCPDCAGWRDSAHVVTRRARLAAAEPAPPPSAGLLALVEDERRRVSRVISPLTRVRLALVAVAIAQIVLTVPQLILGHDHDAPIHVAHEMGSFDLALAVGFLVAAWQPVRARGMHVLVGVAALLLVVTAAIDLLAGRTTPADEAPHLLALIGWALLYRSAALTADEAPTAPGVNLGFGRQSLAIPSGAPPTWEDTRRHDRTASEADANRRVANG